MSRPNEESFNYPLQINEQSHTSIEKQRAENKYSEEDILLLIKFIVKEFSKIIQRWATNQNPAFSLLGLSSLPQPSLSSYLLSNILNNQNGYLQQQDLLTQSLMQQINPQSLLNMLNKDKQNSSVTTPHDRSRKVSIGSQHLSAFNTKDAEQKENADDLKLPERDAPETKDEIDTIHSSEDKTNRNRSISEDTSIQTSRIDLDQAYTILNKNPRLSALLKNISSSM